ncbi:MAG TPA: TonB-dependent receptor [Flavobacterium sp.]|jgi:iron complex outermembrane receptor protein
MKIYLSALLLGLSAILHAQNKLAGTVTDAENKPLAGVSVYAPDLHKGTITDDNGKFVLNNLPENQIRVQFSYLGYVGHTLNVGLKQLETTILIVMQSNVHQMDEVIVSTAFNRVQSQNVMKVEHASVKSLQHQGAATLAEGLATIPGVSQISTGTAIGKPVIRGLSGNRVLVYSQGVRLENQQFGGEHGLGLNDSGIESVEVIKGPASLLYGSDALGGVLYFNPEKFADANTTKADLSQRVFSNTLGSNSSVGFKTSGDKWKFLLRGGYLTHSDYRIPSGERVTNTRFNETDIKSAIGYSDGKFSTIFRYNFNNLDTGLPEEGIGLQSTQKKPLYPKQEVSNHIASLQHTHYFGKSSVEMNLGYILNDRKEFEEDAAPALQMKLETLNYDLKYRLPTLGKVDFIAGVQGMNQTNVNFGEELLIPDAVTTDFGIFTTARFEWKANVVQAGLRFDNRRVESSSHGGFGDEGYFAAVARSFNSYNASAGFKTNINEKLTLRLNVASGFRAPTLAELTSNGVHEGTNRYEIGNAALKNEQNFQYDLNLEFKNTHFEFFVNGFYNHINDYIYTNPTGEFNAEDPVFLYAQQNARLYGGEAGIHLHPHPLDWLHYESTFESVHGEQTNGDYLPLIPANNWNNTLRAEFKFKNWLTEGFAKVHLSHTFSQPDNGEFETATGSYTLLNAGVGGKIQFGKNNFELNVTGTNLFDQSYVSHLSRLKPDGIPNIGRNIILSLNFSI